jgi:hypothetical protein
MKDDDLTLLSLVASVKALQARSDALEITLAVVAKECGGPRLGLDAYAMVRQLYLQRLNDALRKLEADDRRDTSSP